MAKDRVYTQDMGQPPQEPDGASVGRKYVPEQLGSGIKVEKLPYKFSKDATMDDVMGKKKRSTPKEFRELPYKAGSGKDIKKQELAKGGSVSSASKRADGIAQKGKTRGKMC
jgi:hypothetical protein